MANFFLQDKKCVAYLRVSTKSQKFDRQRFDIERFAKERNLEIVSWYEEIISGKTLAAERPVFLEACKFCDENGYTMIIDGIDRLARNVSFYILFGKMKERGDFDIEMILPQIHNGHVSIESLAFSLLWEKDMVIEMLGESEDTKKFIDTVNDCYKNVERLA